MSKRNLELLRKRLDGKLKELIQGPRKLSGLIREPSADPIDEVQSQISADVAVRAINIDWETAKAVEAALERLTSGDYGLCRVCGEPIHLKRLDAIPWAALCARCQSCLEAEEAEVRAYQEVA